MENKQKTKNVHLDIPSKYFYPKNKDSISISPVIYGIQTSGTMHYHHSTH